ncbi:MAG TPA: cytochrome c biogenesis protein CcsA [Rubrivivax sp.]
MILSSGSLGGWPVALALVALVAYALAALPGSLLGRWAAPMLIAGVAAHAAMLAVEIGSTGLAPASARLGFGPVLSLTVCLVLLVHTIESRFLPLPSVRRILACAGGAAVALAVAYPGDPQVLSSPLAPLHWLVGVASYGLFGAAVLHALLLDAAERRLRQRVGAPGGAFGIPLLQLERLTFRFVQAGFIVLSAAIVLGIATSTQWRWNHKTVLSLLGWAVFGALLAGRHWRGWRGQQATRWLYAGAVLLLLAYAGSRFVLEVVLGRVGI